LRNRYKNGDADGKVWGPWSGSSLHYLEVMNKPRWEDYDVTYLSRNRFDCLGTAGRYWRLKEAILRITCLSPAQEQFQLKGLALYIFIATHISVSEQGLRISEETLLYLYFSER
jgi:hypothetical protein